ncbi:ribosome biogenesis GTPase Der [Candidatus Uhrbacteria bacterium]|nr:ribosome biogenesis GTPase Der [Candidatus Uhrbacteria bacterium]
MTIPQKSIVKKPTLALVGRTNVGKSTLFNRLIEEVRALVSPLPGTTRASNYGDALWRGRVVEIVDTGGLERRDDDPFSAAIRDQAEKTIKDAEVIIFLMDLAAGLTPLDREIARFLRRQKKTVLLVGNKAEKKDVQNRAEDPFWPSLGFGPLLPISAVTGMGVGDLLDASFAALKDQGLTPPSVEELVHPLRVAIMGKPNVGKSALLNALVGSERALVSEIAHTTREPQDTLIRINDDFFLFIDTAGIRKKLKHGSRLESLGVEKSLRALERADVALFVLDLGAPIGNQDRHIGGLLLEAAKGVIMVANKWDLIPSKRPETATAWREQLQRSFPFLDWAPMIFVSSKTGEHAQKIFNLIKVAADNRKREIPESVLDRFFRTALRAHRPARGKGVRHPYLYAMKQTGLEPPTFVISVRGRRDSLHPSYLRFLENRLREHFDFQGTPIIIKAKSIRPKV